MSPAALLAGLVAYGVVGMVEVDPRPLAPGTPAAIMWDS